MSLSSQYAYSSYGLPGSSLAGAPMVSLAALCSPAPSGLIADTRIRLSRRFGAFRVTRITSRLIADSEAIEAEAEQQKEGEGREEQKTQQHAHMQGEAGVENNGSSHHPSSSPVSTSPVTAAAAVSPALASSHTPLFAAAYGAAPARIHSKVVFGDDSDESDASMSSEEEGDRSYGGGDGDGDGDPHAADEESSDEGALDHELDDGDDDDGPDEELYPSNPSPVVDPGVIGSTPSKYVGTKSHLRALRLAIKNSFNKSGLQNFALYLSKVRPGLDILDLTQNDLLAIIPGWISDSRTMTGGFYRWHTFKGYLNAVQRIVRQKLPAEHWEPFRFTHHPLIKLACQKAQDDERQREGMQPAQPTPVKPMEMTTRRAERIANGEVPISYAMRDDTSLPSSANSSPRHAPHATPHHILSDKYLDTTPVVSHTRANAIGLSPAQLAFLISQLDPDVPEGLFRLNFLNFSRNFGLKSLDDHRCITLKSILLGCKTVKVKYQTTTITAPNPHSTAGQSTPTQTTQTSFVAPAAPSAAESHGDPPKDTAVGAVTAAAAAAPAESPLAVGHGIHTASTSGDGDGDTIMADAEANPVEATNKANGADTLMNQPADAKSAIVDAAVGNNAAPTIVPASSSSLVASPHTPFPVSDSSTDPFEVCDPNDPAGVWRNVKFIMFQAPTGSRRGIGFIYERPWEGALCPVALWIAYLSHRPPVTQSPESIALWLTVKRSVSPSDSEWYAPVPLGRPRLGNILPMLTTSCKLGPGYTNQSVLHQPKRPIGITTDELKSMRDAQVATNYGIPTKEQHHERQMMANALNEASQKESRPYESHPTSSSQSQPQPHTAPPLIPAPPHLSMPYPPFPPPPNLPLDYPPFAPVHMQPRITPMHAPFYTPEPNHMIEQMKHQQLYAKLDDVINKTRRAAATATLDAGGSAQTIELARLVTPIESDAHGTFSDVIPTPISSLLTPARIASSGSLVSFIDRLQRDLSTLASHATNCHSTLSEFKSFAHTLRVDSHATLQLEQQRATIARQFEEIQQQKFIIEQLRQEKAQREGNTPIEGNNQTPNEKQAHRLDEQNAASVPQTLIAGEHNAALPSLAAPAQPQPHPTVIATPIPLPTPDAESGVDRTRTDDTAQPTPLVSTQPSATMEHEIETQPNALTQTTPP